MRVGTVRARRLVGILAPGCGRPVSGSLPAELERTVACMRAHGLDFMLLASPPSVTYVAGFEAPLPVGFVADVTSWLPPIALVGADGSGSLVLNGIHATAAQAGWWPDVDSYPALDQNDPTDPRDSFAEALRATLARAGLSGQKAVVGVESTLPVAAQTVLADECPSAELRDATPALEAARRIKTPREQGLIGRAAAVADVGQRRLLELAAAVPSLTDVGVWSKAVSSMERHASRRLAVSGDVLTGADTSDWTTPGPSGREVRPGDAILLDLGPRLDGYWADCANTVVFGADPTKSQLLYLTASREACLAGIDLLRPGRRCSDVWHAVADTLGRHGVEMSHYAGHQIGTGVNETPRLVPNNDAVIEAGMVFAVEAGAYEGPGGAFGARAERIAIVTDSDPVVLSAFPWSL
jgi:Xaa-Pro aminopeptidase